MPLKAKMLEFETQAKDKGLRFIFGVDEAGRGPLAGPVIAAAVWLKTYQFHCLINDSKKMTANSRLKAFYEIYENAYVGIGIISESVIDQINILNATHCAMNAAVFDLVEHIPLEIASADDFKSLVCVLIDGNSFKSQLPYTHETIINGDQKSLSIASASIVAKVYRDRLMENYHKVFPQYGFDSHKGYPTVEHRDAIKAHGPSIIHRKSFRLL